MKNMKWKLLYLCVTFQAVSIIVYMASLNLPIEIHVLKLAKVIIYGIIVLLIARTICILIASYIINLSKLILYKLTYKEIQTICLYPIFYDCVTKKISLAKFQFMYNERTCFKMNDYLQTKKTYAELKKFINQRNRILLVIYILSFSFIILLLYKGKYTPCGLSFSSILRVSDQLMIHIIYNQIKLEHLDIKPEVCNVIRGFMYEINTEYFIDEICVSLMQQAIVYNIPNNMHEFIAEKTSLIITDDYKILEMYRETVSDTVKENISVSTMNFFDHYNYLLYVLMYATITKNDRICLIISNYIDDRLKEFYEQQVDTSLLAKKLFSKSHDSSHLDFKDVLNKRVKVKRSWLVDYEYIDFYFKMKQEFIKKYNAT